MIMNENESNDAQTSIETTNDDATKNVANDANATKLSLTRNVAKTTRNASKTTTRANARATRANASNVRSNDAQTATTRDTTRALRVANVRMNKNAKTTIVRDENKNEIVVVRTSSNALRIDHTNCKHERHGDAGKRARAMCRKSIERANDKTKKWFDASHMTRWINDA